MIDIDLILPIYNESQNILNLIPKLKKNINYNFRILFCYDDEKDDIFKIINQIEKFNINYKLIKNFSKGPCNAVKSGFKFSDSKCCIVYPADLHTILPPSKKSVVYLTSGVGTSICKVL